MKKITCIIIEDHLTDLEYQRSLVEQQEILDLKGCYNNPLEANAFIQQHHPRLIFMDIDMPVMNGIDYFKKLSPQPICIFVTAYSEHAWESYELHGFDFILKPVKPERFKDCMNRLQEYLELLSRSDIYESHVEKNTITIKEGTTKHIIDINDILYIEALKDYSKVVTANKKIMTLSKLKHFMEKLPEGDFVRIHRSFAVAVQKIKKITGDEVYLQNIELPFKLGRTFKTAIKL